MKRGRAPETRDIRRDRGLPDNSFISVTGKAWEAEPGFDIIELQFGHGYLPARFISAAVKDHADEHGGSFEYRIRFPMEVLNAVQQSTFPPGPCSPPLRATAEPSVNRDRVG